MNDDRRLFCDSYLALNPLPFFCIARFGQGQDVACIAWDSSKASLANYSVLGGKTYTCDIQTCDIHACGTSAVTVFLNIVKHQLRDIVMTRKLNMKTMIYAPIFYFTICCSTTLNLLMIFSTSQLQNLFSLSMHNLDLPRNVMLAS